MIGGKKRGTRGRSVFDQGKNTTKRDRVVSLFSARLHVQNWSASRYRIIMTQSQTVIHCASILPAVASFLAVGMGLQRRPRICASPHSPLGTSDVVYSQAVGLRCSNHDLDNQKRLSFGIFCVESKYVQLKAAALSRTFPPYQSASSQPSQPTEPQHGDINWQDDPSCC